MTSSHAFRLAIVVAVAACTAVTAPAATSWLDWLLQRDAEIITVTDMTAKGRLLRRPDRAHPVYYEALVLGYREFGRSIAGQDIPPKKDFLKLILKVLADQGYYPATPSHPPEMLLALQWGMANNAPGLVMLFMGGDKLDILWELQPLSVTTAPRWLTRNLRSSTAEFVSSVYTGEIYLISVQALDEADAINGKTTLLWHTKISCPAQGLSMTTTLREMMRQGAPNLGRETDKPVWVSAPMSEGRINYGELKVLEMIDPNKLPITDTDRGPDAVGPAAEARKQAK